MANHLKTYFFPPTWDIPPNGPLSPGSILSSPKHPLPVILVSPIPEPKASSQNPHQPTTQQQSPPALNPSSSSIILRTHKTHIEYQTSRSQSGSLGLWTKFLAPILSIGADANIDWTRSSSLTMHFDRIDTIEWVPSDAEIQSRVSSPQVQRYLQRVKPWLRDVYVVVGVKIASGARAVSCVDKGVGGGLDVGLDAAAALGGVPVEFGPRWEGGVRRGEKVGWEGGDGFVFGFKVVRVKVGRKGGEIRVEEFNRGALFDVDGDDDGEEGEEEGEFTVVGMEEDVVEFGEGIQVLGEDERLLVVPPASK